MKSQVDLLSKELDQKKTQLISKMGELSQYCQNLETERTRLETLLKQIEGEKTDVESLVIQMQEEIEAKDSELGALREAHRKEVDSVQAEMGQLRSQLGSELEQRDTTNCQLRADVSEIKEQMEKVQTENENLESECLKLEAEKAALRVRLSGLVKRSELVDQLNKEKELLKSKVQESEIYIEEIEIRKKEILKEVLQKFKSVYAKTEKSYQRDEELMEQAPGGLVKSMMGIVAAKKYTKKIRLARLFGVIKDFVLSEDNFMGFFSYIDRECSENEEGIEQMLKLFVNSYESIKQRLFEFALQIINENPDFGDPARSGGFEKSRTKLAPSDYSRHQILREIMHNKFLMMSTKESEGVKWSVVNYLARRRSGRIIQKLFRQKKNSLGISRSKFNSSFQKLDFCVFKAATGKSMIKEMLLKMAEISKQINVRLDKED